MSMEIRQGIFSVKLCELEQEYGRLHSRIQLFQEKSTNQLRSELARLRDEYREQNLLMDERIRTCRSPSAASLAAAQLEYDKRVEQILTEELPNFMRGRNQTSTQDQAEAACLYAEYAIDFATQAMRHALIAALSAMILQQRADGESQDAENEE